MTLRDFVAKKPSEIRRDDKQMQLFVEFYVAAFSVNPLLGKGCTGCSFKRLFKKLKDYAEKGDKKVNFIAKQPEMKTFKLKKQYLSKILTYKKNGTTYRKYGNALTEEFARELVAAGKGDLFVTLPAGDSLVEGAKDYDAMDYQKEVYPLYKKVQEATGKSAASRKKEDIIAFLKENET